MGITCSNNKIHTETTLTDTSCQTEDIIHTYRDKDIEYELNTGVENIKSDKSSIQTLKSSNTDLTNISTPSSPSYIYTNDTNNGVYIMNKMINDIYKIKYT